MKEWLEHGYYETVKRVEKDTLYQALLERCAEQEYLYQNIMQKLPPGGSADSGGLHRIVRGVAIPEDTYSLLLRQRSRIDGKA
jgi:hypothetical protein